MPDRYKLQLGKKPTTRDPRTLRLARYVIDRPALEAAMPRTWNGYREVESREQWPMYGNDMLGDCVVAASAHMVETWQANASGALADIDDTEVLRAYWAASGGQGPVPPTYGDYARERWQYDNGLDPLAYLRQWQHLGIGGHQAGAYVQVDASDPTELRLAAWLGGGLFIGLELPMAIQPDPFVPWIMHTQRLSGDWQPGSWGGHMVNAVYTNPDGGYLVTWGRRVRFSWTFIRVYADVIFAVLSQDMIGPDGKAPNGFDLDQLRADLAAF
jgi:hypothetical protein